MSWEQPHILVVERAIPGTTAVVKVTPESVGPWRVDALPLMANNVTALDVDCVSMEMYYSETSVSNGASYTSRSQIYHLRLSQLETRGDTATVRS